MATFHKIAAFEVGVGGQASIDFTNIPASFTNLLIKASIRTNRTSYPADGVMISLNSSTTSFTWKNMLSDGGNATSSSGTDGMVASTDGIAATANTFGNSDIYISDYASANFKTISSDSITEDNNAGAGSGYQNLNAALWSNTAAVTTISLKPLLGNLFLQLSSATLYGISKI